jgi:predicted ester cyclase
MTDRRTLLTFVALSGSLVMAPARAARAAEETAANSAILDRYVAAFNAHDVGAFDDVIAEAYIQHNGRAQPGLAGTQAALRGYFATFPDFHMQIDDRIFGADKVVARGTLTATHSHPVQLGPGAPVFQPTGRKLAWGSIEIWRVANGKFAEHWDQNDFAGLARQLRGE